MPRYRVRPEDRRRSSRACEACKAAKKRCDSQLPCSSCVNKGRASSCAYSEGKRARLRGYGPRKSPAVRPTDGLPITSMTATPTAYPTPDALEGSPLGTQQPRVLLSVAGEKVYIGNTAAISFLDFVRKTLRHCAGPSAFTESQQRHIMLEATVQTNNSGHFKDDLEDSDKINLIQHFLDATSGLLYVYTDEMVSQLLVSSRTAGLPCNRPEAGANQIDLASLYLMIAIGAQCRGNGEPDIRCSAKYFSEAQQMAFRDKLYNPSLSMIATFLLKAFYMLCACRRNTAMMYLGVASQAATILGLHLPELNDTLPPDIKSFRIRMCRSLRILDTLCNAILGRPGSTPPVRREELTDTNEETASYRMLALNAAFDSCSNIAIISQTLTKQKLLDADTAENFLQMLRDWAQALPEELRQAIKRGGEEGLLCGDREYTIGNIHVACSYYFGVVLVTRQFLVASVSPKLGERHPSQDNPQVNAPGAAVDASKTAQLSRVCIGAAKYLVQLCHDAGIANLLLGNMCILQAWVFAAGLVLGYSVLVQSDASHPDDRVAFAFSREVLKRLSRLSPQAQRYYEILSSFCDAIDSYHNQLRRDQRQASNAYLEQIFRLELSESGAGRCPEALSPWTSSTPATNANDEGIVLPPASSLDGFSWSQPQTVALTPEVSDELGFQLLWDEYTPRYMAPGPESNELFRQVP